MKFKKLMACAISLAVAAAVIPQTAFAEAEDDPYFETDEWSCIDFGNSIGLEAYLGEDVNVVIPEEINGKKVTALMGTFMLAGEFGYADVETVYVPASIEFMGGMAIQYSHPFYSAGKLVSITVDENNKNFKSENGVLFSKDMTILYAYPAGKSDTYEIPKGVTTIAQGALAYSKLTSVTIPDTVTEIEGEAFAHSDINTVNFGKNVKYIGERAFQECKSLKSVTLPKGLISISNDAFLGCTSLDTIDVDETNEYYQSDGGVLFSKNIKKLIKYPEGKSNSIYTIPNSVEVIDFNAFRNCTSLTEVTIPNSVTSIKEYAFWNCDSLTKADIPDSVTTIEAYAFSFCGSLTKIVIPASVTSIGEGVFSRGLNDPDITIYGYIGSAAEAYAKNNHYDPTNSYNIYFSPLPVTVKNENATVEGILPYDTTLNVEKTDESETSVTFDITLSNKDGNAVQPTEAVNVKLPVPEGMATEGLKVYRAESNGKYTDMKATFADGSMTFTTDHFSTYVITAEELDKEQSGGSGSSGGSTGGSGSSSGSTGSTGSESASDTAAPETSSDTSASSTEGSTAGSTDSEDKNQNTGVALLVLPAAIAAAGIVISRKRR